MQRVQGDRADSILFYDPRTMYGYYRDHVVDGNSRYFGCEVTNCRGRVIWRFGQDPEIEGREPHNHPANPRRVEHLQFKQLLRERAENETIPLRNIFVEEQRRNHDVAVEVGGFQGKIKQIMERARKTGIPPIPRNFTDIDNSLRNARYMNRFGVELGPMGRDFYRGLLQVNHGVVEQIIYFVSPTIADVLQELGNVQLHMDGTFRVVPVAGGGLQLFTVQVLYEHSVFPILYAVMERKTKSSYDLVLQTAKDTILNDVEVVSVMVDYEAALRQSIREIFPNARLLGCWFHYCKAVYSRGRQLGLTDLHLPYEIRQGVKMGMALALLPAHLFENGRVEVQRWMLAEAPAWVLNINNFAQYLERQWGTANVSVHGLSVRTNNSVESFHKSLIQLVGRRHPNIWMFVSYLQKMEHSKACDLIRLRRGVQQPTAPRVNWVMLDNRIRNAEAQLENNGNVGQFLRRMSHAVDGLVEILEPVGNVVGPVVLPPAQAAVAGPLGLPPAVPFLPPHPQLPPPHPQLPPLPRLQYPHLHDHNYF